MLAETKSRRCIRSRPPRRSHANPQSSAHLKQPSSCLAGAADPPPGGPTACPERKQSPGPGEQKRPSRSQQNSSGTGRSSGRTWDPLEEHSSQRAADSPGHARPAPATWRAYCLPGRGEAPRARRTKAATQEAQDRLGTAPPAPGAWDPLGGEYYNHRAADGPPQQFPALPCIGSLTALEILPNPQSSALL